MGRVRRFPILFTQNGSANITIFIPTFRLITSRSAAAAAFARCSRARSTLGRPTVMTDDQLSQAKGKIFHVPTVLGADVPAYNIPGVTGELKFTPETLAGIFLGKISSWNDPT